ncbi:DUF2156 domain-containing protein [Nanchangia anserum]|uniref:phosphatidylglycerol lysyltransferase domain-containing protein n=1 Tax=Nanchangia anserum TaxID=2692125 RepID=UPI001883D025|nr:phosphatidylglycerol lysyltransferase domain-containing protein [Nanchangia anserum]QOX82290.1 DUF2156 domain-containing protein [Nanchangia anserum]
MTTPSQSTTSHKHARPETLPLRSASRYPTLAGWVCLIAAIAILVSFLTHQTGLRGIATVTTFGLWILGIPAGVSLGYVVIYLFLAVLAFLRKRLVVIIGLVLLGLRAATLLLILVWFIPHGRSDAELFVGYALTVVAMMFTVANIILMWRHRRDFPGSIGVAAIGRTVFILIGGLAIGLIGSVGLLQLTRPQARPLSEDIWWSLFHLIKPFLSFLPGLMRRHHVGQIHGTHWLAILIGVWVAIVIIAAILAFFRAQSMSSRTREEDRQLRNLLYAYGSADSLGYFATRDNRRVVFSADGKACVSYGLAAGIALAGGDPIGDRSSWATPSGNSIGSYESGYVPAVISASEAGAAAYRAEAKMSARLMGDEQSCVPRASMRRRSRRKPSRLLRAGFGAPGSRSRSIANTSWPPRPCANSSRPRTATASGTNADSRCTWARVCRGGRRYRRCRRSRCRRNDRVRAHVRALGRARAVP